MDVEPEREARLGPKERPPDEIEMEVLGDAVPLAERRSGDADA